MVYRADVISADSVPGQHGRVDPYRYCTAEVGLDRQPQPLSFSPIYYEQPPSPFVEMITLQERRDRAVQVPPVVLRLRREARLLKSVHHIYRPEFSGVLPDEPPDGVICPGGPFRRAPRPTPLAKRSSIDMNGLSAQRRQYLKLHF